jgi:hypothetical protein
MSYTYTTKYYAPIKNEIMTFAGKETELETMMVSEASQT